MTGAQDALSRGLLRASPEQRVGKLAGIEAGRGIAAIGVVLCHVALILTKTSDAQTSVGVFQIGRAGVDFFFVLSGFVIAYAHREDIGCPARLGHYLSRRLFRIMPTYWIALALTLMLGGYTLPAFDMARAALLLPSSHGLPVIVAWTLQYELVFYVAFSFLIVCKKLGVSVLVLWLVWILASLWGQNSPWVPQFLFGPLNIEFFLGMGAAYLLRKHTVLAPRLVLLIGFGLFCAVAIAGDAGNLDSVNLRRIPYGIAAAVIVVGVVGSEHRGLIYVPTFFQSLGAASYSIYLFHVLFITFLWAVWLEAGLDRSMTPAASFLPLVIGGVGGGMLISRLVEFPLMRLLARRPQSDPDLAATARYSAISRDRRVDHA
jgi:peptidoglycan/LPS O-acetylase OafA/YrhL